MASRARSAIDAVTAEARALAQACIVTVGLKQAYDGVLAEAIPQHLTDLINSLPGGKTDGRPVSMAPDPLGDPCGCGRHLRAGLRLGDMAQEEDG